MIKILLYFLIGIALCFKSIRANCIVCDSKDNLSCNNPFADSFSMPCSDGVNECFMRVFDRRVIRGCKNQLEELVWNDCTDKADDTSCRICNYNDCNTGVYPHDRMFCHHCTSEKKADCAKSPGPSEPCKKYMPRDECIVRSSGNQVIRECLSDYVNCSKDTTCKRCATHGCNKNAYNTGIISNGSLMFIACALLVTKFLQ